ncbi:AAA family ATPase [Nocardia sp. NPDC127526]|uniref:AAA family ATPase n=1 Tax=Nocardia sp. NPDC127526 TaxID=3345393 RepID=UPI003645E59D
MREKQVLYGRGQEQDELDRMLVAARSGSGSAVVLWGDPGIGKSALLNAAADRAGEFRILRCRGSHPESELPFAALHELLLPVAGRVSALPAPQAAALGTALGAESGPADDFLVGAALVALLSALAAEGPVLLIVDDAQLVDDATARALVFAARRLVVAPVVLLCALRDDPAATVWSQLCARPLTGLSDADARLLLEEGRPGIASQRAARALQAATGNPLALRELPIEAEEFAGIARGPVPLGPRLRAAFRDRIAELPDPVRTLLLVVAAEARGVIGIVATAATALDIPESAWEQAESAGWLEIGDGRVEMRHRLLCTAAYDAATPAQRRRVHLAVAAALTGPADADRASWHRAIAADRPDAELAAALAAGAERAETDPATAAAMLRRAAAITPDPATAGLRLAAAARQAWEGGDIESACRLLDRAAERVPADRLAVASGGLAGRLELVTGEPERASRILLRDAEIVDPVSAASLRTLARRARWAAGHDDIDRPDFEAFHSAPDPRTAQRLLPPAALVLMWGMADRALEPYTQAARWHTAETSPGAVCLLPQLATLQFANGRWAAGEETLAEAFELARSGGVRNMLAQCWNLRARLAALRGDADTVAESVDRALALARPSGANVLIAQSYWQLGFLALGTGNAETAHLRLRALMQPGHEARHPTYARLAALDMVDAACRVGRFDEAAEYYELIRDWAVHSRATWAIADAYACRALLGADDRTDHYFRRALAVGDVRHGPVRHARIQLHYGKWLRRNRRRGNAAEQLRAALEAFERAGADQWATRARLELDLTGKRPAVAENGSLLTTQELRVALLAAQGMTNRAIGAELLLSPRTVGHHLSRIFGKLGLSGRAELAAIDFENGMRIIRPI